MISDKDLSSAVNRVSESIQPSLQDEHRAALVQYLSLLFRWSKRINLTGFKTATAAAEGLLFDAFEVAPLLSNDALVVDVGAGAGGIAITLATLLKNLRIRLVEPRHKRAVFLRTAIRELGYSGRLEVFSQRIEELEPSFWTHVDIAYAQAVFPPAQWLALSSHKLPAGSKVLCLTARPITASRNIPPSLTLVEERVYSLPLNKAPRAISAFLVGKLILEPQQTF